MFNQTFYPTPLEVINTMLEGIELQGKTILEPSAGSGNIVDELKKRGSNVIACEKDLRLLKIVQSKCNVIAEDFLKVQSEDVVHIDGIIMNPPFINGAEHLLHAFSILPKGGFIVCLLNAETLRNSYSLSRKELRSIIEESV